MQAKNGEIVATIIVCTILLGLGMFLAAPEPVVIPEMSAVPTAAEIAALIVIPVAPTIDMPDTILSVRDEKKAIALDLVKSELDNNEFEDALLDALNDVDGVDIEDDDIISVSIQDSDVSTHGDSADVELEIKVKFDNFGDEDENEYVVFIVDFEVEDLDRDDDYEDAEVVEEYDFDEVRNSLD